MNFEGIKLIVATDNIRAGLSFALGVSLAEKPKWCLVTDDPKVIAKIPEDIASLGHWTLRHASQAELAWRDRQASGRSSGVSPAMLDRIADWQARRAAEERRLAFAHLEERIAEVAEAMPDAQAIAAAETKPRQAGGSKWR